MITLRQRIRSKAVPRTRPRRSALATRYDRRLTRAHGTVPMPQQYIASDARTGLEVQVTGNFPGDPGDRVRIARTTNLFTRLMATILAPEGEGERRERFRAIETQLEGADRLLRGGPCE